MNSKRLRVPYFLMRRLDSLEDSCSICNEERPTETYKLDAVHVDGQVISNPDEVAVCDICASAFQQYEASIETGMLMIEPHIPDSARRFRTYNVTLQLENISVDVDFEYRLYEILRQARLSFFLGIHWGVIALSSSAVEFALNSDTRRPPNSGWKNTNPTLFQEALGWGAPIQLLLESNEYSGTQVRRNPKPAFIERRNKYAHGEYPVSFGAPLFDVTKAESESSDQLLKAQTFLFEWAKSNGNPIVKLRSEAKDALIPAANSSDLAVSFRPEWDRHQWY